MPASATYYADAIVNSGAPPHDVGVLFPARGDSGEQFVVRRVTTLGEPPAAGRTNDVPRATPEEQQPVYADVVVRLPSIRESKWKVTVLQRWIGRVEKVDDEKFVATLSDATDARNPMEQVELEIREVSESDLRLLVAGSTFYWSIGYRDTLEGQRERVSTLRFARQPRLSKAEEQRVFERADHLATVLERD